MRVATALASFSMLAALGAGCSVPRLSSLSNLGNFWAAEVPSADVDLATGSTITLAQTSLNPLDRLKKQPERVLTLTDWAAGDHAAFDWSETYEQETAASVAARDAAEHATGVGEEPNVPDPVYETIALNGSLASDALDDGDRILLPSEWEESQVDLSGSPSTVLWLSKAQYDELANTRHTHLAIGVFDSSLQTAADAAEAIKGLIAKIQGSSDSGSISDADVTEIAANADWGSYTLTFNTKKVRVQTIQAENQFASYTILANPDNPLILKVDLKAWAYGTEALGLVSDSLNVSGYSINAINNP